MRANRKTAQTQNLAKNLTPVSEVGQRFTHWFNHGWDFIKKTGDSWTTINTYPLSRREIWDSHQNPNEVIGLRFGSTTRVIIIDLDRGSPYHRANNPDRYKALTHSLEDIGLCRHVTIQSSASEGIHIIYPLPEAVPTFKAACLVQATLISAGLEIKKGQLEIFPNPKRPAPKGKITLYNGIRLPLQPNSGSYLLDDDLNITSERVEDFNDSMDWAANGQDIETFTALLDRAYEDYKAHLTLHKEPLSQKAAHWKQALETIVEGGWTGYHQTNYLITKIVTYQIVFAKLSGQKLREQVKQSVINAPGYAQYCRHQHEIDQRIQEICHYTEINQYYLPYCNYPDRSRTFNQTYNLLPNPSNPSSSRKEDIKHRITQTVAHLEKQKKLPSLVAQRRQAIQKATKELFGRAFSITTLNQRHNLPLWHPQHRSPSQQPETRAEQELYQISETPPQNVPPQTPQPLTPSSVVSNLPINEVSVTDEKDKKEKLTTTTNPQTLTPTDNPPSNAPVQVLTTTESHFLPPEGPDAPINPDRIPQVSQSLESADSKQHKAHIDANKQMFVNLGLPIPDSVLLFEAELARMLSLEPQPTDNDGEAVSPDALAPDEELPEPTVEPSPQPRGETPQEKPRKVTPKMLIQKCEDYGVKVNSTIRKLISSNPVSVVSDALEALREHKRDGLIINPAGFLVKAISQKWRPSEATFQPSNPSSAITDEFLNWYKRAIAAGVVEELPVEWLPMYQHREPMVRVLPPLGREPYTLMRWQEALNVFKDF